MNDLDRYIIKKALAKGLFEKLSYDLREAEALKKQAGLKKLLGKVFKRKRPAKATPAKATPAKETPAKKTDESWRYYKGKMLPHLAPKFDNNIRGYKNFEKYVKIPKKGDEWWDLRTMPLPVDHPMAKDPRYIKRQIYNANYLRGKKTQEQLFHRPDEGWIEAIDGAGAEKYYKDRTKFIKKIPGRDELNRKMGRSGFGERERKKRVRELSRRMAPLRPDATKLEKEKRRRAVKEYYKSTAERVKKTNAGEKLRRDTSGFGGR